MSNKWHSTHFLDRGCSLSGIPLHSWQSGSSLLAGGQPGAAGVKEPPQAAPASEEDNASPHNSTSCFSSPGLCVCSYPVRGAQGLACGGGDSSVCTGGTKREAGSETEPVVREGDPAGRNWEGDPSLGSSCKLLGLWARHRVGVTALES